jgi:hypothetical protein
MQMQSRRNAIPSATGWELARPGAWQIAAPVAAAAGRRFFGAANA